MVNWVRTAGLRLKDRRPVEELLADLLHASILLHRYRLYRMLSDSCGMVTGRLMPLPSCDEGTLPPHAASRNENLFKKIPRLGSRLAGGGADGQRGKRDDADTGLACCSRRASGIMGLGTR